MDVRYLVLTLFFLASCMPSGTVSKGNLASTETTGGTTGGTDTTAPTALNWNYLGEVASSIVVNVSNLNNAYVVGTSVEEYLGDDNNFNDINYCTITTFSVGGVRHEVRSRTIPISYYDFKNRKNVRILRVDFLEANLSASLCNKTSRIQNADGEYIADPTTPAPFNIHYEPGQICPLCTSMLTSIDVRIFKYESTTNSLDEVPANFINATKLDLLVDPNYSSTGSSGSCSNSECKSRGFDCCLENQCVKDGATKPAAITQYSTLLQTAEIERLQNPLAYLNYPQLYYICGSSVPTTPGSTTGTSAGGSYDEAFLQLKKDYECVEHIKAQATTSPFHNELTTASYIATTDCLTAAGDSSNTFYYQNVFKRMYQTCGCSKTNLSDMISNCPNYDYTVTTRDTTGEPVRIDCYTPETITVPIPMDQSVSVSSRAAPHRFFDTNGVERNPSDGIEQEGDTFEYLDEGKVLPQQENFGMNSILGQMSVTLDKALPAKSVSIELDQIYFISTTTGYYTPCPTCAKDSWLSAFTAFPMTASGVGIQAVGYTTERDNFATNTSAGNYEDTIFGRACWLPPTMLPYTHSLKTTVQSQRLNRLQAQAALFVNGYQRDWFGFNKGALIASFDGVRWFAVGKGRIVRSTSKKLFLAINAPFADVASPTMHVVRVSAFDGITQAAQVDYDPTLHQYHPSQNEAGNCQRYHFCSTDTDCITKLGWEYSCADVKDLKTNWPEFDADAKEKAGIALNLTLDQILQQKKFPSASTKRCVYRGAGAVCHVNSGSLASTDLNKTKLLTCAPNFYCANLNSSSTFNNKISRYAAALDEIPVTRNHVFGKDANILGRPHDYLGTASLTSAIRSTLIDNLTSFESTLSSSSGLCQPGKSLPTASTETVLKDPFTQHKSADASKRTDYISQIGSCNSTLYTNKRHTSCPVLNTDGNYEMFANGFVSSSYYLRATNQNSCGLESLKATANLSSSADTLLSSSPFRAIEGKTLNSQIIVEATFARDACFRRAGSVCHTDLDCSPNKMHATQVDFFPTFFGNDAEKAYWSEYLVCGQADSKPLPTNTDAFKNYDMTKNRCCREIGKDLTTYTKDIPLDTVGNSASKYNTASYGLKMSLHPGTAPNDAKRYSRLATVDDLGLNGASRPYLTANIDTVAGDLVESFNITTRNQWKTLNEANSESCCGGGWIRKFADGSNDWSRRDRLALDVTNFRCINSRTPLLTNPESIVSDYSGTVAELQAIVNQDFGDYCKDATNTNGSCAMYAIDATTGLDLAPRLYTDANETTEAVPYDTATINTIVPDFSSDNLDYFFKPRSADGHPDVVIQYADDGANARRNIAIKLPSWVGKEFDELYQDVDDIDALVDDDGKMPGIYNIRMERDNGAGFDCFKDADLSLPSHISEYGGAHSCVFRYDPTTRILKVAARTSLYSGAALFADKNVGIVFSVNLPGKGSIFRRVPGTERYYLNRLGRLELIGIPQIAYSMLRCNDDDSRLVPGIYKKETVNLFNADDFSFFPDNFSTYYDWIDYNKNKTEDAGEKTVPKVTTMHGLQHEAIFSENDFKCCAKLGKTVTDQSKCCSGFGIQTAANSSQRTCALPPGADLMVYFNSFVSNEGRGTDEPGGGLTDSDFSLQTGEPLLSKAVNAKIASLGVAYCSTGKVRQGGALGDFKPEPRGSQTDLTTGIYNIVDSSQDFSKNSNFGASVETGYNAFIDGFRWNHHLYCDDAN